MSGLNLLVVLSVVLTAVVCQEDPKIPNDGDEQPRFFIGRFIRKLFRPKVVPYPVPVYSQNDQNVFGVRKPVRPVSNGWNRKHVEVVPPKQPGDDPEQRAYAPGKVPAPEGQERPVTRPSVKLFFGCRRALALNEVDGSVLPVFLGCQQLSRRDMLFGPVFKPLPAYPPRSDNNKNENDEDSEPWSPVRSRGVYEFLKKKFNSARDYFSFGSPETADTTAAPAEGSTAPTEPAPPKEAAVSRIYIDRDQSQLRRAPEDVEDRVLRKNRVHFRRNKKVRGVARANGKRKGKPKKPKKQPSTPPPHDLPEPGAPDAGTSRFLFDFGPPLLPTLERRPSYFSSNRRVSYGW